MTEHELDVFAAATRDMLDGRLNAHAPLLDLEDVVERAHALAPARVPEASVERARSTASPTTPPPDEVSVAHAAALEVFNQDLREFLDAELAPRDMAAVVPPRRLARRRRPAWTWAAAAVVALIAGGAIAGIASLQTGPGDDATQAEHSAASTPRVQTTSERGSATAAPDQATIIQEPEAPPSPRVQPADDPLPDEDVQTETTRPRPPVATVDPQVLADRLAELDALAQAQWKAGDAHAAMRTFEKIVKLGGRTPYAEQAYGELFALAHQLHGENRQAKLWRAYLRRFPRGRYADAARAGLCRGSEGKAKRQCWTRYLKTHPKGAARAEALRETSE